MKGLTVKWSIFRPASDLATYAQTQARYASVRDNEFAFQKRGKDLTISGHNWKKAVTSRIA